MAASCDIGLVGLAVMGENLALNIESRGYRVAVFNRTTSVVDEFIAGRAKGKKFVGCHSLEELVKAIAKPRKVMLMVKAGPAVDALIEQLIPLLSPGDVIIDGGNTYYPDTERRTQYVESKGLLFIGTGVSGGEEGALLGPSIMPGGSEKAWPLVKPIFQAIAAKVGPKNDIPCCEWVGPRGAGHYVKMVHNGIEYGDMQLICEAYFLLKEALGLSNDELYDVFDEWNRGELDSYLIEITRDIFSVKDPETGGYLVDMILDTAGAKGTGKWMSQLALDLGVPSTLVTEAVYARCLSALKDARVRASKVLHGPERPSSAGDRKQFIDGRAAGALCLEDLQLCPGLRADAGRGARSMSGRWITATSPCCGAAAASFGLAFLDRIKEAFDADPKLENLLLAPYFTRSGAQGASRPGGKWSARPPNWAFRCRPSPRPWPISTAIAARACRPTCCRPSAIISAPTPTSGLIGPARFTRIGCGCGGSRSKG